MKTPPTIKRHSPAAVPTKPVAGNVPDLPPARLRANLFAPGTEFQMENREVEALPAGQVEPTALGWPLLPRALVDVARAGLGRPAAHCAFNQREAGVDSAA